MDAFPAFIPLAGKRVVVAGTGEAAEAKARLFEGSPATLVRLEGQAAGFASAYAGASLAFVAGDEGFCQTAAQAARGSGCLVNVVDRPELSDFHTPALIDRGAVVAAIGTAGAAPMLAALLRTELEPRIPAGAGRVAVLLKRMQAEVREAFPDLNVRRAFLRQALEGEAAKAAMDDDMARAEALLRAEIAAVAAGERPATPPAGRIVFVQGRGDADLLTLRAARVLADADVVVPDEGANPAILALARRDAGRIEPAAAHPEGLVALARANRLVVVVIVRAPDMEVLRWLAGTGVPVEVMLAAPG